MRSDVLPARRLEHLFLAVRDFQETVVHASDVARVEPIVGHDFCGFRFVLVVPHHHVESADEDLVVRAEFHFNAVNEFANVADAHEAGLNV